MGIAELTGKPHNDILKAIRKMEPAWTKIAEGKFSLGSYVDSEDKTSYLIRVSGSKYKECLVQLWLLLERTRRMLGAQYKRFCK